MKVMKQLKEEVFEVIYHHYISTGWEHTIEINQIPFPTKLSFNPATEDGICQIEAYGVCVEGSWSATEQEWKMDSHFIESQTEIIKENELDEFPF